jgi:nucleotide-binding universal stress UspA family protein
MLVALSARPSDDGLLDYAAMLRRLLPGLEAITVHVATDADRRHAGTLLAGIRERLKPRLPDARCEVVAGDVLDSLLDLAEARRADLILLGHAPRPGRSRRSLARRLAMKAPCSVWLVPSGSVPQISRILAPVDFSRRSADTLDLATGLAELAGLDELIALNVYFNDAAVTFDEFDEMIVAEKDQAFGIFVAPINLHGVFARPMFVESAGIAQTVCRVAAEQGSDLIVMGTRGRSRSAAVLLGSEAEQTLMTTTVPVLTVKHFGARLRLSQVLREERLKGRAIERYT